MKYLSKFKSYPLTLNESSICGRQREKLSTILHFLRDTSSKRCCVMIKWLSKVLGKQFDRKIEKRRRKHALSSMLWWKESLSEYYLLLHEARNSKKVRIYQIWNARMSIPNNSFMCYHLSSLLGSRVFLLLYIWKPSEIPSKPSCYLTKSPSKTPAIDIKFIEFYAFIFCSVIVYNKSYESENSIFPMLRRLVNPLHPKIN